MKTAWRLLRPDIRPSLLFLLVLLLLSVDFPGSVRVAAAQGQKQVEQQILFSTPEEAVNVLAAAVRKKDRAVLAGIFGAKAFHRLLSGDRVQDNRAMEGFSAAVEKSAKLVKVSETRYTLAIGERDWPFPIPIVKEPNGWHFDTQAGMDEILNRRIGQNELSAIMACRAYVLAQWQYFTQEDVGSDGVAEYAQKFISSPGKRDGLYWETVAGEKPSPLGSLVAAARAEGYGRGKSKSASRGRRTPYHGYYFKILTRQGSAAPGGKYNYIINGHMIAGYALVAYPDRWGSSGVMTFIVNQQGRVYQKNLGAQTAQIAGAMTEYNPDPTWEIVNVKE